MKHYFKKLPVFLYICVALIAYSCAEEKNVVEEQSRIKKVNLSDLPYLQRELNKETSKGSFARGDIAYYLDKIIAENIIEITDQQGLKNYTFALNFRELDTLFNLSAKETIDGYSYTLMKYTTPNLDQWIQDIKTTQQSTVVPEIEAEPLDNKIFINSGQGMCTEMNFQCPSDEHHTNINDCHIDISEWILTIDIFPCHTIGGGGTDGGDGPIGPTGPTVGTGPTGGSSTGSGPGVITMPNVDDEDNNNETPCDQLKKLIDPAITGNLRAKLLSLRDNSGNANGELGFKMEKNGDNYVNTDYPPGASSNGYNYSIPIMPTIMMYGVAHTHPVNGNPPAVPMFSFGDLQAFVRMYIATDPANRPELVMILVIPGGPVYALKIENYALFATYVNGYNLIPDVEKNNNPRDKLIEKNQIFDSKTEHRILGREFGFLKEMKNKGIGMYEAVDNIQNWKKLEIPNSSNSPLVERIPCN